MFYPGERFTAIKNTITLTPKEDMAAGKFLYYLFTHVELPQRGAGQPFISKGDIEAFRVSIPESLEEQRKIVEKLDSAFAEIDLLEGNLFERESVIAEITAEKLDQIFRKKTDGTNNSQQVALSEIARVINGRAYNQPELLKQGKYPVLRVGNFFSNRSWYYSDLELDKDKYCDNGDLLYAWSASFGPRIWDGGKVIYHYHIWKVEEKKEMVLRDWLYWWFLWDVKQIKEAHGTGSTMMHVTKGAMENRFVQLPSLEMQSQQVREIAELQLATQKIESNYNDLAKKLFELKNAVLSSAFEEEVA
jgi:type I restriction enzyme S subunit